jgi:N-acetyl-gamma-glutamyl-phosphate reductase
LIRKGIIKPHTIAVASSSGVSGAGKKVDATLLFSEVNESVRVYGAPKHRHLSEIEQEISIAAGETVQISFVPQLMPVTAGISTTIFCAPAKGEALTEAAIREAFDEAYGSATFVRVLGEGKFPDTKNVVGTNFIDIGWVRDERTGRLILLSTEDNLGKGASSQAIQNFNLMFDLPETAGLLNF